ncbi:unnamed protein product [Lactuca virosa]|uniref:Uncharacterized protein n=1 Tax=Lactuca virosa TaxID=75947 RepID=A0AAU9MC20_9ASTR|nr:unnamed protein product [Lactuca virosa]
METLSGCEVTVLEQLHRKRLASSSLVTKEVTIPNSSSQSESSLDSNINPSRTDIFVFVVHSPTKKIVKSEPDSGKPPFSSTKVVIKGSSLKIKTGSERTLWKEL